MNNINVRGHLVRDAVLTETSNNTFILKGTIADNYGWGGTEEKPKVNWMAFTRFMKKKPSDAFIARLTKGTFVIVDGRLETSKRKVKEVTYLNLEVIVNNFEIPFAPRGEKATPVTEAAPEVKETAVTEEKPAIPENEEELPF